MDVLLNDFEGKCMSRDMCTVCFCFCCLGNCIEDVQNVNEHIVVICV